MNRYLTTITAKALRASAALALAIGLAACGGGGGASTNPTLPDTVNPTTGNTAVATPVSSVKAWTLMVYIAGDNNLSEFALADLNELRAGTANANVNIVVQMEYNGTFASSPTYTGGTTYRGAVSGPNSPHLTSIGSVNMSNKAALTDFINFGKTYYPAQQYGLVLWSHGGGWKANKSYRGESSTARGALADDSVSGFMSMKDIQLGIANAMGTQKLDVLAFDACLMGHYEVAYELRNATKLLVASEELVPGPGMPYTAVVNALTANPTQTPVAFANAMASAFNASYTASSDTTMSVFDTAQAATLHTAVLGLATALVTAPEPAVVTSAKAASNGYGGTGNALFAIDLFKFADYISINAVAAATKTAATAVKTAITAAVGTRVYNTGGGVGSKGVGIYMPPANTAELNAYALASSSNDAVAGQSTWKDFLANYYGNAASSGAKVAGNFAFYITWDNVNADVDLVVNEPKGNWAAPWIGSTSPNGFLSSDSTFSGQNFESYTAASLVDGGNTYDVFVNLFSCKNGLTTCTTQVKVYKKDGLNGVFTQVLNTNNAVDGSFTVCKNCFTASYPFNDINGLPYSSTSSYATIVSTMWNSSDWYPITAASVTRTSVPNKLLIASLKALKFGSTVKGRQ